MFVVELLCGIFQCGKEVGSTGAFLFFGCKEAFQCAHRNRFGAGREYDGFTLFNIQFEIARNEQILVVGIAALLFFQIFDAAVPIGLRHKSYLFVGLHHQIGITGIHTTRNAVFYLLIIAIGFIVFVRQFVDIAECEERFQAQFCGRMGFEQGVTDQHAVFARHKYAFFLQNDAAHAVNGRCHRVDMKFANVLMPARAEIIAVVFVNAEIELCSMLNDRFVARRQQHMVVAIQFGNRHYQQAVVFTRIAVDNRGAGVCAGFVGAQHFFVQRLFEIGQQCLVKF